MCKYWVVLNIIHFLPNEGRKTVACPSFYRHELNVIQEICGSILHFNSFTSDLFSVECTRFKIYKSQ